MFFERIFGASLLKILMKFSIGKFLKDLGFIRSLSQDLHNYIVVKLKESAKKFPS